MTPVQTRRWPSPLHVLSLLLLLQQSLLPTSMLSPPLLALGAASQPALVATGDSEAPSTGTNADGGRAPDVDYSNRVAAIEAQRVELARRHDAAADAEQRTALIAQARAALRSAIADQLIPPWLGTPWAFSGTADRPHGGPIACGFFVGTILGHAGFRLDRIRFGVLPAQRAIERVCDADAIAIFSNRATAAALAHLAAGADGVYLVGLDYHIGLVIKRGQELQFCHSTVLGAAEVLCEPAAGDNPLTQSSYLVIGELLTDHRVAAWLAGQPIALGRQR